MSVELRMEEKRINRW